MSSEGSHNGPHEKLFVTDEDRRVLARYVASRTLKSQERVFDVFTISVGVSERESSLLRGHL